MRSAVPRAADGAGRAAGETTVSDWDLVSEQPLLKAAAARITLVERDDGTPAPAPTTTASPCPRIRWDAYAAV
ncbi:hypothetical protein ACH4PU_14965 [Streptomyces sp. NPDC021100]|uniref:hypothetical protein n=1 Tax=Streptomyces sp. NPDC021100 TaxID=3365114 RepID=UPI00378BCDAE